MYLQNNVEGPQKKRNNQLRLRRAYDRTSSRAPESHSDDTKEILDKLAKAKTTAAESSWNDKKRKDLLNESVRAMIACENIINKLYEDEKYEPEPWETGVHHERWID